MTKRQVLTGREQIARAMKEDELLANVLVIAKVKGWHAYHVRNAKAGVVQGDTGFPDLVLVRRKLLFVELKTELGDIRPEQVMWAEWLKAVGHTVRYWRPSDWMDGIVERALE